VLEERLAVSNVRTFTNYADCVNRLSLGNPVILLGKNWGLALALSKWDKRSVEEPSSESVVRGPREGFIEALGVNIAMLRRRIRSPQLKIHKMEVGNLSKTNVAIAYIEGVAENTLIEEIQNRIRRIDVDWPMDSGIEEYIEDNSFSPFPQWLDTERPDVVVANLVEGRVAILVDGDPFALIAPVTFYSFLQTPEDYYQRIPIANAIRWLRYIFTVIALLLPSLYVAVITYHQEMVPTTLLVSMAASREQVPFPALVEALIMEITFEALREAGVRLPKQIGSAVSIVGALVIGEAAVAAGIVSAPMVIVVAITGIASFTIPRYTAGIALRLLRFPIMFLAGTLGLLGIMLGIIAIVIHLCSLRSLGVPYLQPMAPMIWREMKDVLIRQPMWASNTRPHFTGEYNKYRRGPGNKPGPEKGDEK
jgi:spore germination protein KA